MCSLVRDRSEYHLNHHHSLTSPKDLYVTCNRSIVSRIKHLYNSSRIYPLANLSPSTTHRHNEARGANISTFTTSMSYNNSFWTASKTGPSPITYPYTYPSSAMHLDPKLRDTPSPLPVNGQTQPFPKALIH